MKELKDIIAENIVALRKKNNLTQNELAEKLMYSDNAVSRWERGEVTPSIETLSEISKIFNVPIASLLEENATQVANKKDKKETINKLAVTLIYVAIVWMIATVGFVYSKLIFNIIPWKLFVWAVPVSCLVMLPFNAYWGKYVYKFVIISVFQWTLIACIYLQFLQYNLWAIFLIGIPSQVALCIWAFIKPKNKK